MHTFRDLSLAAYCPRKLYYARRDGRKPPPDVVEDRRELAFRYEELLSASDETLARQPLTVEPATFRTNLEQVRERFAAWPQLCDPSDRNVLLGGRECRGVVHKVLELDPPTPSLVSAGEPPDSGVWKPQSVLVVAAAKALAWERERPVERAFVEFPARGVVREVRMTTRRKAAYRATIRAVESLDGPPPRLGDRSKCGACEYRDRCGVRTRTLRSLLG